jgi:hypothetical protein
MKDAKMTDPQKLKKARVETLSLAAQMTEKNRPMMLLARETDDTTWLWLEYQMFFMNDVYLNATGEKQAHKQDIIALVATREGAEWIERQCANPFWFWSLLGAACQCASTLPLTVTDLEEGARLLFEDRSEALGHTSSVSGWPVGYSGPQTPWHTWDLFSRGYIWNNHRAVDVGITYGLLLMQRFRLRRLPLLSSLQPEAPNTAQIIYNPLFAGLSTTPPVGNDSKNS